MKIVCLVFFLETILSLENNITLDIGIALHYIEKKTLYKNANGKKIMISKNLNNSHIRDIY